MRYDHEAVLNLWARGRDSSYIAAKLQMSHSAAVRTIVQRARRAGDPRAHLHIFEGPGFAALTKIYGAHAANKLNAEARARGITIADLVDRVIRVAVSDNLFGSILDDGVGA